MAYDPYKSLLANATREHLKHSIDLNTHLVGNVFLPAIDSQLKKPSKSHASLKRLKVIEQCIMAENKREDRLAKCATSKARRVISKKFQAQRERERELIQALMLGQYPERLQDIKLLETEVVPAKTPRQQLNQEITGLTAKVATPDRVFRKTDVTGGVPKSKPHAHKKFTLPQCNGSPGKKSNAKAQAAAAANLSSRSRGISLRGRETQTQDTDEGSDSNEEPATVGDKSPVSEDSADYGNDAFDPADDGSLEAEEHDEDDVDPDDNADDDLETDVAETLFDIVDMVEAAIADEEREAMPSPRTVSPRPRSSMDRTTKYVLRIQSVFRGYRARIAFRLALYEDALSCGVLGAMPGTIQGRSGWYLDPKRLMAYYFSIPEPGGDWEQKYTLRCSRLVLTPYEMREEVLSKVPALLQQSDVEQDEEGQQ
uniref:Uncharacterized protein n=1 Tax=Phytophthora ramorum TaxID=164328 RepID=H3GQ81_PHYRM